MRREHQTANERNGESCQHEMLESTARAGAAT